MLNPDQKKYVAEAIFGAFHNSGEAQINTTIEGLRVRFRDAFSEMGYEIDLDDSIIDDFFILPSEQQDSEYEIVESDFARTRFLINTYARDSHLRRYDARAIASNRDRLGEDWFGESLNNIFSNLEPNSTTDALESEEGSVPASDRYVSLNDNQSDVDELETDLASVKEAIRGNNEAEEEARLVALSEIAIFEQTICQPRLSVELIERFLNFCRSAIVKIVGAAVANSLINKLSSLLEKFLASLL